MSSKLTRAGYVKLLKEDLEWLMALQGRSHTLGSIALYYRRTFEILRFRYRSTQDDMFRHAVSHVRTTCTYWMLPGIIQANIQRQHRVR